MNGIHLFACFALLCASSVKTNQQLPNNMQEDQTASATTAQTHEPLVAELEETARQIEAVKTDARDLLKDLSDEQFNWQPAPGHWSIAECLDHLAVTGRELNQSLKAAIDDARSRGLLGRGPFRYGVIGNILVRSQEPPVKMKFKAPKLFRPREGQSLAAVTQDFFSVQDEVLRLIREANGLHLARVKVTSPVTNLMKLSLGQAFNLVATHERRHLWQARQVRTHPAFPSKGKSD